MGHGNYHQIIKNIINQAQKGVKFSIFEQNQHNRINRKSHRLQLQSHPGVTSCVAFFIGK